MGSGTFEEQTLRIIYNIKHKTAEPCAHSMIPVWDGDRHVANLRALTVDDINRDGVVKCLADWREKHSSWFQSVFKVTFEGTRKWLDRGVIETPDRILFMLEDLDGMPIGHMGFFRFDFKVKSCEVDNIVRGENAHPGIMTHALAALMRYGIGVFGVHHYRLQTYADNIKAVSLYARCGFTIVSLSPMVKKTIDGLDEWVPALAGETAQRFSLVMENKFGQNWVSGEFPQV